MNSIIYVNTPLSEEEHQALAALARAEGRSKGQQLRSMALASLAWQALRQKSQQNTGTQALRRARRSRKTTTAASPTPPVDTQE